MARADPGAEGDAQLLLLFSLLFALALAHGPREPRRMTSYARDGMA